MVIHFLYFYQKNYARKDKGKIYTQSEQSRTIITSDFKCSLTFM